MTNKNQPDPAEDPREVTYDSPGMHARRRRILAEARDIIARGGYANFSIRELASRAQVAQRTLYNAFSSKDRIIASAIYEYHADFTEKPRYKFEANTLTGRVERIVKIRGRELHLRNYTDALMKIFNTEGSNSVIRSQMRSISVNSLKPFVAELTRTESLARNVSPEYFVDKIITFGYASLTDWCNGQISDENMVTDAVETFLIAMMGMTRGVMRKDTNAWLKDVRRKQPRWLAMLAEPEVTESPSSIRKKRPIKSSILPPSVPDHVVP